VVEMRFSPAYGIGIVLGALCLCAPGQDTQTKRPAVNETKGIPARAAPADYQAHAAAGTVTVAAEFLGHSIPRPEGDALISEDYVVIEMGLFGPPEARLKISVEDFALRVNNKKAPVPGQPFGMVFRSLKDPDWEPPEPIDKGSKTGISTGGKSGGSDPPAPVHMPLALQVALPEGERALPQGGLIFFPYHGRVEGIHSLELTYDGPAGKVTMALQP
jgi:hypothetical protein